MRIKYYNHRKDNICDVDLETKKITEYGFSIDNSTNENIVNLNILWENNDGSGIGPPIGNITNFEEVVKYLIKKKVPINPYWKDETTRQLNKLK